MRGTIVYYHNRKKYGFIQSDDGKSVFFHLLYFEPEIEDESEIQIGARVSFEAQTTARGLMATDVQFLKEGGME